MKEQIATEAEKVSIASVAVADLAAALGVSSIKELPGCWEYNLDENWFIAVNGHREPTACSKNFKVAPFHCYVEWCGWPAGEFHPTRGGFIAAGGAANEDTFIEAIQRATEKAKEATV